MLRAIPGTLMRGGTSKALYFHAQDLPQSARARDKVLLAAMGSPDPRQINGVGQVCVVFDVVVFVHRLDVYGGMVFCLADFGNIAV